MKPLFGFLSLLKNAIRDLLPIVAVVLFFQTVILQQSFPDVWTILVGLGMVIVGLALFVQGLEMALFPIGDVLAEAMAKKGSLTVLLCFAFALGFGTTVAEPALIAVVNEASMIAAQAGEITNSDNARESYAFWLRLTVAVSVGSALVLGVFRILLGWPVQYLIIGGYFLVVIVTFFAPPEIIGIAYDLGGVTTSTITVPLVTALGVGLSKSIRGRSPLLDGFGLIALASLMPMIFVMVFGMVL